MQPQIEDKEKGRQGDSVFGRFSPCLPFSLSSARLERRHSGAGSYFAPTHSRRYAGSMRGVTQILSEIELGDPRAADDLLPLVYDELRKLAAQRLAHEKPGQTLAATALVHEAYLRLVGDDAMPHWNSRGHFFAAAAEAMRRILVENARRKQQVGRGGDRQRAAIDITQIAAEAPSDDLVDLDESLERLEAHDPVAAKLVKLRYFAGLTMPQAAEALGMSLRTAERNWTYARTWLHRDLHE
jgi:RNA polymerase sigma factor (TIGR02999 family)